MKTSQRERVLAWMRRRGQAGVHSFELYEDRIPRAAAVVHKLRQCGYTIESRDEVFRGEAKGVRYVLVAEPGRPAPPATGTVIEASGLFGVEPRGRPANPYEYEAA